MANSSFYDINLPGLSQGKTENKPAKKIVTGVEPQDDNRDQPPKELRLISAKWAEGPEGFQYNKICYLDVKVEYLKNTIRKKIRGDLWGVYNNEEIDFKQTVDGEIDDNSMTARMVVRYLYFINDAFYAAWQKNTGEKCSYILKNIRHTLGENTIDSQVLEMPQSASLDKDVFLYSPADSLYYRIYNKDTDEFYTAIDECNLHIRKIQDEQKKITMVSDSSAINKLDELKNNFVDYLKEQHTAAGSGSNNSAMGSADPGMDKDLKEFITMNVVGRKDSKGENQDVYKGWVYVRSDKVKNHWRKTPQSKLIDLFGPEEKDESGKGLKNEIKEKFKEKMLKPLQVENVLLGNDKETDILAPKWVFSTGEKGADSEHWDFSAGAQFLRFSAGASLKSEVNLKTLETKIEAAGSVSFALAEGKSSGAVYIPDKNGFDIAELLIKGQDKLEELYGNTQSRKSLRTGMQNSDRKLSVRMTLKFEASGFIGSSASIAFPRLNIKPVKGNDPKSERVALATFEGRAFAGAKGEGKVSGDVAWGKPQEKSPIDWKSMVSAYIGGAVSAGIGAEGGLHFGYIGGHIRFSCSFGATFVVGGKTAWDFDIGLISGLEFLSELAQCVDFHFIAAIAEDLYEILEAYKYVILLAPGANVILGGLYILKDIDQDAQKAEAFVKDLLGRYRQVTNYVDKGVQNVFFGADKKKRNHIMQQSDLISKCPPESIARHLLVFMKEPDEDDYIYIPGIMDKCESDHKVRWVLRYVGLLTNIHELNTGAAAIVFKGETFKVDNKTVIASNDQLRRVMEKISAKNSCKEKDVMLEKGAEVLLEFGGYKTDKKENKRYVDKIMDLYDRNGVAYD